MPSKKPVKAAVEGAEELVKKSGELVGTTIKIACEVWQAAKIEAIKRGITLAGIIEEALRRYLKGEEKTKGRE